MANILYRSFKRALLEHRIDFERDKIKVMLTMDYLPDDGHAKRSEIKGEANAGRGYERGGKAINGFAVKDQDGECVLTADDVTWPGATVQATGAVMYQDNGSEAEDELVAYFDFGRMVTSMAGAFILAWGADGVLTL
jgi:hypothetical protein